MLLIVGCSGLVGTSVMVWSISGWPVDQAWMEFGVSSASVAVPFDAIVLAGVSPSSPGDSAVNHFLPHASFFFSFFCSASYFARYKRPPNNWSICTSIAP